VNTTREYLTAGELACHLRVSKRTVWRWAAPAFLFAPRESGFRSRAVSLC
jgi:hypothetical protein